MKKIFKVTNNQATSQGAGVCVAMTFDWISQSKALGRVTSLGQLNSSTWLDIQDQVETGPLGTLSVALTRFGLSRLTTGPVVAVKPQAVPDLILKASAYLLILADSTQGGKGHAMGARHQKVLDQVILEYFDPCMGLYAPETECDPDETLTPPNEQLKEWFNANAATLWSCFDSYKLYEVG